MGFGDGLRFFMLFLVGAFMILLILVQRGKGGGLAGAFGGMGGQSAFGTKAGDLFTRITIGAACVWILLCVWTVKSFSRDEGLLDKNALGSKIEPAVEVPSAKTKEGTKSVEVGPKSTDTKEEVKGEAPKKPVVAEELPDEKASKPEVKAETKPEVKPEVKAETKPEVKAETKTPAESPK